MSKTRRIDILGVKIDALSIDQAVRRIVRVIPKAPARYVIKPYVEFFEPDYHQLLSSAWLRLPDGVALQWAAYFQTTSGTPGQVIKTLAEIVLRPQKLTAVLPERFAGLNFTRPLLEAAAAAGLRVYLVGAPQGGSIEQTANYLQSQIKGLKIVGTTSGRSADGIFSQALEHQLLAKLRYTEADLILVGLGFPLQERLMQRLTKQLDHGVLIGEGGSFDYRQFGGRRRRAPRALQEVGLEWLWRLALEPRRWRRQLAIPHFIWRIYKRHGRRV